ncbi:hypothetical protein [Polyangium sorediatum]|uniref:hypothetical protein n=1 Tax=Polyangium sorediatum TaxID=889274 RepID=UPI0010BD7295|nr:hypothetical protein [Polyangium sorediatum]
MRCNRSTQRARVGAVRTRPSAAQRVPGGGEEMTLGERLKGFVGERKQAALAAEWLERWSERKEARKGKGWTLDTVTSSFSRCFNDQPEGVRFFFGDRARAVLLFEVLAVPPEERDELLVLADLAMKTGAARPAQLVVDLTAWTGDRDLSDALFLAVEKQILEPHRKLLPVVLVMTEEQYRWLPRTFDDFGDDVRKERVKECERARERVMALAEDQGLVLAPYPLPVFERWVATSFRGRELRFEPADALAVFAERGELPRLPAVEHDLASLGGIEPASEPLPEDPLALRRLMVDLCVEERVSAMKQSAAVRLGWAHKLGITVTSTERERIEAEISALDARLEIDAEPGDEAALEGLLARARRRPVETTAMRVGDVIHILNPTAQSLEVESHPRITVHRIDVPVPALVRLLNELDTWTEDDLLDDPLLEHVVERLDPRGEERLAMLHARAQVMVSRTTRLRGGERVDDWKTPLGALLAEDPPEAMLRLHGVDNQDDYNRQKENARRFLLRKQGGWANDENTDKRLRHAVPLDDLIVSREDQVLGCKWSNEDKVTERKGVQQIVLESDPIRARDPAHWLDLLECSAACGGHSLDGFAIVQRFGGSVLGNSPSWENEVTNLGTVFWREADRELALAWLSLRRSLGGESIRLRDGSMLALLGGGIFAEFTVRQHSSRMKRSGTRASLLLPVYYETAKLRSGEWALRWHPQPLTIPIVSHLAETTSRYDASTHIGPSLPRAIRLEGHGIVADVTFRYSPLFTSPGQGLAPSIAAAAAAASATNASATDDDDRRRRD